MDKITREEDKKNQNTFIGFLFITIFLLAIVFGIFTNFKAENLICSLDKDICYVEKTNFANMKFKKNLLKYSNISEVQLLPQKVKGNRYAKSYKIYLLIFRDENYNPVTIFNNAYFDKSEANKVVNTLNIKIKNKENFINIKR